MQINQFYVIMKNQIKTDAMSSQRPMFSRYAPRIAEMNEQSNKWIKSNGEV